VVTITERVRDYICRELAPEVDPGELADDTPLIDGGVLDSISIFQLMAFLEQEYRVPMRDEDLTYENLHSLAAITALVSERLPGQPAPSR
jgi:acyl carrier protein